MSLTVVGSIAYDAVKTPFGERKRMLGGAATHFALAASFFDKVRVVGPVGEDFDEDSWSTLRTRGTITDDVEQVSGGRTFFWKGEYSSNLNSRETHVTELNVFESFVPKLSDEAKQADVLFLANIQPALQQQVREQCDARFVAMDSMDLWINIAHSELVDVIRSVDCVMLNDEELEMLTERPNLFQAAQRVLSWGPRAVVAKQGKYGAVLYTDEGFFALPAYPLQDVVDPTGAGDTFAGAFVGFIAAHPDQPVTHGLLKRAMAYGTAVASYNVEEFGTERVQRLTAQEIHRRVDDLSRMTTFSAAPLQLRG